MANPSPKILVDTTQLREKGRNTCSEETFRFSRTSKHSLEVKIYNFDYIHSFLFRLLFLKKKNDTFSFKVAKPREENSKTPLKIRNSCLTKHNIHSIGDYLCVTPGCGDSLSLKFNVPNKKYFKRVYAPKVEQIIFGFEVIALNVNDNKVEQIKNEKFFFSRVQRGSNTEAEETFVEGLRSFWSLPQQPSIYYEKLDSITFPTNNFDIIRKNICQHHKVAVEIMNHRAISPKKKTRSKKTRDSDESIEKEQPITPLSKLILPVEQIETRRGIKRKDSEMLDHHHSKKMKFTDILIPDDRLDCLNKSENILDELLDSPIVYLESVALKF